jgi:L-lactate dehydrogenase complex protein LldE
VVVQFFHTCLVTEVNPEADLAAARVLERLRCQVEVSRAQSCCSQPAYNGGFHRDAAAAARHTVEILDATEGAP